MRDFDRRQFRLFLRLLNDLGSRRELTSQFGLDQHAMLLSGGFGLLIGGFIGLAALGDPPVRGYLMAALGISAFWLVPRLVSQAADAFMNPAEVSVLAHRPIRAGSYLAAKFVFVLRAALVTTLPLNLVPAFAGATLEGTRWFYPLTHMVAATAGTAFTALVVCGIFGLLFRFLPIGQVRAAALWLQLAAVTVGPFSPQLLTALDLPLNLDARVWSAIPVTWFAAVGLVGQPGRAPLDISLAVPAMALSAVLVALGVRSLTQGYLTRVSTMMRLKSRGGRHRRLRDRVPAIPLPGGQGTRAGVAFIRALAPRDWQFRRMFLGGSIGIVILFGVGIGRRFAESPLAPDARAGALYFLPLILGILMLQASVALAFTDRPGAKWIFQLTPARGLRGMVRGMYWALWAPLAVLPNLAIFVAGTVHWGFRDAAIFSTYSLAVTSLYLGAGLWLAGGLPFTKPPDPTRGTAQMGVMMVYLVASAALGVFQRFVLFPTVWLVPIATIVLAVSAWLAAAASFRVLESRVLQTLVRGDGRQMFTQFEEPAG
jgi:hypothetical protein